MEIGKLNSILYSKGIIATELVSNTKASEEYVNVIFTQEGGTKWEGYVPYQYRRTGLHIELEDDLAKYLISIKPYFVKNRTEKWVKEELEFWKAEKTGAAVTFPFFEAMCSLKWTDKFPLNDNPARRIQDIKDYQRAFQENQQKDYCCQFQEAHKQVTKHLLNNSKIA
ncbi:hypothetical protein FACS1894195_5750 [Bacteroidia bacterium]|nr:hypothetical protein FACS1894195_5750 [Bacteroidia bacterium]